MLAVKAKHATMLLTVSDVEGLPEGMEDMDGDKSTKCSAQFVTVREHKLMQCEVSTEIRVQKWFFLHRANKRCRLRHLLIYQTGTVCVLYKLCGSMDEIIQQLMHLMGKEQIKMLAFIGRLLA